MRKKMVLILIVILVCLTGCSIEKQVNEGFSEVELNSHLINHQETQRVDVEEIMRRKEHRQEKSLVDALIGVWILNDESEISFDENLLSLGDKIFKYIVDEQLNDELKISVFAIEGFLVKGKKVFDMKIGFDDSRCNAQISKIFPQFVGEDLMFLYDLVYKDNGGIILGSFDDVYFN